MKLGADKSAWCQCEPFVRDESENDWKQLSFYQHNLHNYVSTIYDMFTEGYIYGLSYIKTNSFHKQQLMENPCRSSCQDMQLGNSEGRGDKASPCVRASVE